MLKGCLLLVISNEQHFKRMANKNYLEEQLMNDVTGYFSEAFDSVGPRQMGDLNRYGAHETPFTAVKMTSNLNQ